MKIFRNIRFSHVTKNKISKYLAYAIGEIILVVIGILIALAINNSNQQRIIKEKEQVYLAGLRNEFQTSKLKLEELIKVNKTNYDGARQILEFIAGDNLPPDEKQFSEILFSTFANNVAFNPNNSMLVEMINSGSLKDVSNNELKLQLTNWVSTLEDIAKQEFELGVQRDKVLDMFREGEHSLRTIFDLTGISERDLGLVNRKNNPSNLLLLKSREFENNVLMFFLTSHLTKKHTTTRSWTIWIRSCCSLKRR